MTVPIDLVKEKDVVRTLQQFVSEFGIADTRAKTVLAKFIAANCASGQSVYTKIWGVDEGRKLVCANVRTRFMHLGEKFWNTVLCYMAYNYVLNTPEFNVDAIIRSSSLKIHQVGDVIFYPCVVGAAAASTVTTKTKTFLHSQPLPPPPPPPQRRLAIGRSHTMPLLSEIITRVGRKIEATDLVLFLAELCDWKKFVLAVQTNPFIANVYARDEQLHWDFREIYEWLAEQRRSDIRMYADEISMLLRRATITVPFAAIQQPMPQFDVEKARQRIRELQTRVGALLSFSHNHNDPTDYDDASSLIKTESVFLEHERRLVGQLQRLELSQKMKVLQLDISSAIDRYRALVNTIDWRHVMQSDKAEMFFVSLREFVNTATVSVVPQNASVDDLTRIRASWATHVNNLNDVLENVDSNRSVSTVCSTIASAPAPAPQITWQSVEVQSDPMVTAAAAIITTKQFGIANFNGMISNSYLSKFTQHIGMSMSNSAEDQATVIAQMQAMVITFYTSPCEWCQEQSSPVDCLQCVGQSTRCDMLNEMLDPKWLHGHKAQLHKLAGAIKRKLAIATTTTAIVDADTTMKIEKFLAHMTPLIAQDPAMITKIDKIVAPLLDKSPLHNLDERKRIQLFLGLYIFPYNQMAAFSVLERMRLRLKTKDAKTILRMRAQPDEIKQAQQIVGEILKKLETWRES